MISGQVSEIWHCSSIVNRLHIIVNSQIKIVMKIRKTAKANLENKKPIFFQIGLILALVLAFMAFEYKTYEKMTLQDVLRDFDSTPLEITPITIHEKKPPPPVQPVKLKIVDKKVDLKTEVHLDIGADQQTEIPPFEPVFKEEPPVDDPIVNIAEVQPIFPGGLEALYQYLKDNVRFPKMAKEIGAQGTVYVAFVVEKDGSITNIEALRNVSGGCTEEAIRVVQNMPPWNPGLQRGMPVRVSFTLPIKFTLRSF